MIEARQAPNFDQSSERGRRGVDMDHSICEGQRHSARYFYNLSQPRRIWTDDQQALEGKNVKEMLLNVGSAGGGAAAASSGGAAGGGVADAPAEEAKKEEKEEGKHIHPSKTLECTGLIRLSLAEKEESDEDMGLGLFD